MIIHMTRYITKLEMRKKKKKRKKNRSLPTSDSLCYFSLFKKINWGFLNFGQREAGNGQVGGLG